MTDHTPDPKSRSWRWLGGLASMAAGILPWLGPVLGYDITPDMANEFGEWLTLTITQLGAIGGGAAAWVSKIRETKRLG